MSFVKGKSGNPAGRPKGSRHRYTLAAQALLDGEAEALTRQAVTLALAGDTTALRLCLERLLPPQKDRPITVALPPLASADDAAKAMSAVVMAMADGDVTPAEATAVAGVVETYRRTLETAEIERRVAALEDRAKL